MCDVLVKQCGLCLEDLDPDEQIVTCRFCGCEFHPDCAAGHWTPQGEFICEGCDADTR